MILRSDRWNVHGFVGAKSWISLVWLKYRWNSGFRVDKSSNLIDYASQKPKSSWNGSWEEHVEVWVVGSTQLSSANLAAILAFSQTLLNDEFWRPYRIKSISFFFKFINRYFSLSIGMWSWILTLVEITHVVMQIFFECRALVLDNDSLTLGGEGFG